MTHHWFNDGDRNRLRDYYAELGVPSDATESDIRSAYRKLARQWHPDRNKSPEAEGRFKNINEAYAVLSDNEQRAMYDAERERVLRSRNKGASEDYSTHWSEAGAWQGTPHTHQQGYAGRSRRSGVYLHGVELPSEFAGASIFNDFAISPDRTRFAYVGKRERLVVVDIPKSGKVRVDGYTISYNSAKDEVSVRGKGSSVKYGRSGISASQSGFGFSGFNNVSVSMGTVISTGSGLESEISRSYDAVGISEVRINNIASDVKFGISNDGKVYVSGTARKEPELANGCLYLEGLEGRLELPKSSPLTIEASLVSGDVSGDIAHPGRISTVSGHVLLRIYAPLMVEAASVSGEVSVRKMVSEGRGVYTPPNAQPKGRLSVKTTSGDIHAEYVGGGGVR